jgi:hypothetical protein
MPLHRPASKSNVTPQSPWISRLVVLQARFRLLRLELSGALTGGLNDSATLRPRSSIILDMRTSSPCLPSKRSGERDLGAVSAWGPEFILFSASDSSGYRVSLNQSKYAELTERSRTSAYPADVVPLAEAGDPQSGLECQDGTGTQAKSRHSEPESGAFGRVLVS